MPFIEINGKKIEADAGSTIIEVADKIAVQIPRFCYHKKLSVAANCRMCLVEVEKSAKPLPACATPIAEGMKIWTRSPMALLAQKSVMEFLLINHPLDCPICDQGGECELQDLSLGYGSDTSRYNEEKRVVQDKDLGPLISTDMTRCIQCTRCVRFGTEIAGVRELGAMGKGECLEISTYIEQSVVSEVSGNIIDLCPVGALTSKPYRFTARGFELKQTFGVSPHDCMGSNLFIHTRRNRVMRVVPKENENINETWISDRDRYSYEGLYHLDRLQEPKLKREGKWQTVSWEEALTYTAKRLLDIKALEGAGEMGALISPNATVEEAYLLQKLMRGLGSDNIDYRLRQSDFRAEQTVTSLLKLSIPLSQIEQQSVILLIGSAVRQEQPTLALKIRKAALAGANVLVINPIDFDFNFNIAEKSIMSNGDLVLGLARLAKAVLDLNSDKKNINAGKLAWLKNVENIEPMSAEIKMAEYLMANISEDKKIILLGALAIGHPQYANIIQLAEFVAELTGAKIGILSDGANAVGVRLAGCVPDNAGGIWGKNLDAYLLFNLEPDLDCLNGQKVVERLNSASFVVSITPFESPSLLETADVLLPMVPFVETSGTFINVEGTWQSFKAATVPLGNSRPGWKILRVLGNLLDLEDFDAENSEAVLEKVKTGVQPTTGSDNLTPLIPLAFLNTENEIRIAPVGLYAGDGLVRRAKSLQETAEARKREISNV
jgi:NADH-quinone oxidoreductase subunit G